MRRRSPSGRNRALVFVSLALSFFAGVLPSSESSSSLSVYIISCCLRHAGARNVLRSWRTTSVAIAATDIAAAKRSSTRENLLGGRVVAQRRAAVEEGRTHVTIRDGSPSRGSVGATRRVRWSVRNGGGLAARLPDFQFDSSGRRKSRNDEYRIEGGELGDGAGRG
jgi:hypothetical protein